MSFTSPTPKPMTRMQACVVMGTLYRFRHLEWARKMQERYAGWLHAN